MRVYIALALGGLPLGAMYALQALGIVIVFKTSRVFTFATGAVGLTAAYAASWLNVTHHVPIVLAVLLATLLGVVIGIVMERVTIRGVHGAINRTIVTLGWLIALQGVIGMIFDTQTGRQGAKVFSSRTLITIDSVGVAYGVDQVAVFLIALGLAIGLAIFFRRSAIGTAMRAVADDPEASRLLGLQFSKVTLLAWGIGGGISALAGILITPLLSSLDTITLIIFTIQALAAALVGRLESLPLTFAGGLALGALQPVVEHSLRSWHLQGLRELTALIVILVALMLRKRTGRGDIGAGGLVPAKRLSTSSARVAQAAVAGVALTMLVLPLVGGTTFHIDLALVFIWSLAVLSIVLLTGVVGQVSVCQAVFMGMGAYGAAIAVEHGVPFLLALVLGGAFAALTAVLVGLPAMRLAPLELAIATLSLAFTADTFLYLWQPLTSKSISRPLPRPSFANVNIGHIGAGHRNYVWLTAALFAIGALIVVNVRSGRIGAALTALRSSEAATAAMGFSVVSVKLRGFALSGFLAGVAGGAFAGLNQVASGRSFDFSRSIILLAFAVIAGVGSVSGALIGGVILTLSTISFGSGSSLASGFQTSFITFATGVLLIGVLRFAPEGITGLAGAGFERVRRSRATPKAVTA